MNFSSIPEKRLLAHFMVEHHFVIMPDSRGVYDLPGKRPALFFGKTFCHFKACMTSLIATSSLLHGIIAVIEILIRFVVIGSYIKRQGHREESSELFIRGCSLGNPPKPYPKGRSRVGKIKEPGFDATKRFAPVSKKALIRTTNCPPAE